MRKALVAKVALVVAVGILLTLPSIAAAVLSGANGRIVYISGRGYGQAETQVYLRIAQGTFGFGTNAGPFGFSKQQHRHPTWSPDRTKIAYAAGPENCAAPKCDIYVLDLTNPFAFPENITETANVNEDRPAWSPDGTRIAYESEISNGSGQVDILVDLVGAGATLNLTKTGGAGEIEGKPAWTPDSAEIYYHTGDPTLENKLDIVKEPSGGGAVTAISAIAGINEFQPSLSPDGKQLCFTRGTGAPFGAGAATNDVVVSLANGGAQNDLSDDLVAANYNCTWSPTGVSVAYVTGAFTSGDLILERADDTSGPFTLEAVPAAFDGNPDWAPDGRPTCKDVTANTAFDQPVTIGLQCFDTGPFYERSFVREFVGEPPKNGTVTEVTQGDQEPSTVTYTPNNGFSGTDTFELSYFDEIAGFGESKTVTVNVAPGPPAPKAPVVSNVKVTPRKAKAGAKLTVRWTLDEAAATKLTFKRAPKGKKGKRRFVTVGAVDVSNGQAGANALSLPGGRLNGRKLAPGRYRVSVQARDADNLSSKVATSSFQVVPKKG